jgi:heterodisulfide reductase subunit D
MTDIMYTDALKLEAEAISDACVSCGKCFEACPMTTPAGLDGQSPVEATSGIRDMLKGGVGNATAQRWSEVCTNSGSCIPACEYGINPRFMMNLAAILQKDKVATQDTRRKAVAEFRQMSRGVTVLSRLQLSPDDLVRVNPGPLAPRREQAPEVLFYTGCNVLKTPHIALLCLSVLDMLNVDYAVVGGASHCCGFRQFRAGDALTTGRVAYSTLDKLAEVGAQKVLSWCPTCQIQLGEIALPAHARSHGRSSMTIAPFVEYLAGRLDELRPMMKIPVNKRVALNERPTYPGVTAGVKAILSSIPGLELVELDVVRAGATESNLAVLPAFQAELRRQEFQAAADAKVTTLATVYHTCHREICHFDNDVEFEIVNFMELVGESMGLFVEDIYKRLKIMRDVEAIITETQGNMAIYGLDDDMVRESLLVEYMSVQPMPTLEER